MKKLLCLSMIFIFLLGCENTQKSNGFNTAYKDYSFHIGSQSSVDVVVDLDKVWGRDYDKMRTFFADTAKFTFADGETYDTIDGFLGHVKKEMDNGGSWTMDHAFAVDLLPGSGGELVNASFSVEATETKPKRIIHEWYYVIDEKIHNFSQSKQVIIE